MIRSPNETTDIIESKAVVFFLSWLKFLLIWLANGKWPLQDQRSQWHRKGGGKGDFQHLLAWQKPAQSFGWVWNPSFRCLQLHESDLLRNTNRMSFLEVGIKGGTSSGVKTTYSPFVSTPPKTNMEPEEDGFQKESPFPGLHFQVPC